MDDTTGGNFGVGIIVIAVDDADIEWVVVDVMDCAVIIGTSTSWCDKV